MNNPLIGLCSNLSARALILLLLGVTIYADETPVSLKATFEDHFMMGVAVNRRQFSGRAEGDVLLARAQFNSISSENALQWQSLHPREGLDGFDFENADRYIEFGLEHGMYIVGHTLVWHSQTPDWVFSGSVPAPQPETIEGVRRVYSGPRASREELLERMRVHIYTVVGRYKGKIQAWDVVNEALADGDGEEPLRESLWKQIIGPDYVAKAFQFAHEADPDAILRYNDYGLENPKKRKRLIKLIREL